MKHDDIYAALGQRIRQERNKAGLTLEELAEASSISSSFLAYLEHGKKKASLATVKKLADGLGIPVARLFANAPPARADYGTQAVGRLAPLLKEQTPKDREFIVKVIRDISKRLGKKGK